MIVTHKIACIGNPELHEELLHVNKQNWHRWVRFVDLISFADAPHNRHGWVASEWGGSEHTNRPHLAGRFAPGYLYHIWEYDSDTPEGVVNTDPLAIPLVDWSLDKHIEMLPAACAVIKCIEDLEDRIARVKKAINDL